MPTFHTRIPNSTFICQELDSDGKPLAGQARVLQFHGGNYTTEDPMEIAQLNAVADKSGSQIYLVKAADPSAAIPAEEVKQAAARTLEKIAAAGQRV